MNKKDFERLCESIKQAGEIRRGTRVASRVYRHEAPDVKLSLIHI